MLGLLYAGKDLNILCIAEVHTAHVCMTLHVYILYVWDAPKMQHLKVRHFCNVFMILFLLRGFLYIDYEPAGY